MDGDELYKLTLMRFLRLWRLWSFMSKSSGLWRRVVLW